MKGMNVAKFQTTLAFSKPFHRENLESDVHGEMLYMGILHFNYYNA